MAESQVAVVEDWLVLAQSLGPAMLLEVQVPITARYLLCHVLGGTCLCQVPGRRLLGPRHAITDQGMDALVRDGWLPPSPQTMHWTWTAAADVPVRATARLLVTTAETVLGSPGQALRIGLRPCGESTCAVHAEWTAHATGRASVIPSGPLA